MRNAIAHGIHDSPGNFAMRFCKFWMAFFNVIGSFANNLNITNYRVLHHFILKKRIKIHLHGVSLNT